MSKRKMCKWHDKKARENCSHPKRELAHEIYLEEWVKTYCPKNTTKYCRISTKRPKWVKVKGWAVVTDDGVPYYAHTHRHSDSLCGFNVVPCFISVEAKWLKGSKG